MSSKTSISDYSQYRNLCLEAASNDLVFENFRRYSIYNKILEHKGPEHGQDFLDIFKLYFSSEYLERFKINDHFGNPRIWNFGEYGDWSPTTLYYIKVLYDIICNFENIEQVIEIGGGYGGQCSIIKKYCPNVEYTIFDLPEPIALTKKYLDKVNISATLKNTLEDKQIEISNNSLLISNWAFSELNKKVQDEYIEKILNKTKHGYLLYNMSQNAYTWENITELMPYIKVQPTQPSYRSTNKLLWW